MSQTLLQRPRFADAPRRAAGNVWQPFRQLLSLPYWLLAVAGTCALAGENSSIDVVPNIPHNFGVQTAAISSDGARIFSVGLVDNTAKLWDVRTGHLLRTFSGFAEGVEAVAFSRDGLQEAAADGEKIYLWRTTDGSVMAKLDTRSDLSGSVRSLAYSPDGQKLACLTDEGEMEVWDAVRGRLLRSVKMPDRPWDANSRSGYRLIFSGDGTRIHVATDSGYVYSLDSLSGRVKVRVRSSLGDTVDYRSKAAVSSDGSLAIFAGYSQGSQVASVEIWDPGEGRLLGTVGSTVMDEDQGNDVESVVLSPDAHLAVLLFRSDMYELLDLKKGVSLGTHGIPKGEIGLGGALSSDGQLLGDREGILWLRQAATGHLTRRFGENPLGSRVTALSRDGGRLFVAHEPQGPSASDMSPGAVSIWDLSSGSRISQWAEPRLFPMDFSPSGRYIVVESGLHLQMRDASTGAVLSTLQGYIGGWATSTYAFSADERRFAMGTEKGDIWVWDTASGRQVFSATLPTARFRDEKTKAVEDKKIGINTIALSADGSRCAAGQFFRVFTYDVEKKQELESLSRDWDEEQYGKLAAVAFVPEGGLRMVTGPIAREGWRPIRVYDVQTAELVTHFTRTGPELHSLKMSQDGKQILVSDTSGAVELWETSTGHLLQRLEGHSDAANSFSLSMDGKRVVAGSDAGAQLWSTQTGNLLSSMVEGLDGEWVALTPAGFFASSAQGAQTLAAVRGLQVIPIQSVFDSLHRPDLVQALLVGDPEGKYKDAAYTLNLEKALDSGPPPQIDLLDRRTEEAEGTVRLSVRLTDQGGGIGQRMVWRVNGNTQGDVAPMSLQDLNQPTVGRAVVVSQTLRVDQSQTNTIEISAYNGTSLVSSEPLQVTVDRFGAAAGARPQLYALAVGVDKYKMEKYRLSYAVKDAGEFVRGLESIGGSFFSKVNAKVLADREVSREALESEFRWVGDHVQPQDVFVLYLAGHGKSVAGRYFYYPQAIDFEGGDTVERNAIGQDELQRWLAMVYAGKKLVVIDTCESGSAGGIIRGSSEDEAAMQQLQHATGQNLIAASREAAYEGYHGHGVLTYALLEAFAGEGAPKGDDRVNIGYIAQHVEERVPAITRELFGVAQEPIRVLSGNDFPLGVRQHTVLPQQAEIPVAATHVLVRAELLRERPSAAGSGGQPRKLAPGTQVRVLEYDGEYALVARMGQKIGYLRSDALLKLQ
jgi:WD40 repeat protein